MLAGASVRDYSLKTLRDAVAVVLQNNTLFTGTIRENLQWGKEDANDEELMAVCQTAQAAEFIEKMPEGLDTMLGQGGVNLSGGQKQRLCIARALLKYPKIIILDDSTSAVDTATGQPVASRICRNLAGCHGYHYCATDQFDSTCRPYPRFGRWQDQRHRYA